MASDFDEEATITTSTIRKINKKIKKILKEEEISLRGDECVKRKHLIKYHNGDDPNAGMGHDCEVICRFDEEDVEDAKFKVKIHTCEHYADVGERIFSEIEYE